MRRFRRVGPSLFWIAWVLLGTMLHLGRHPGGPFNDSIWAEDGNFFLSHALAEPITETVALPVAGYMHLAPRVVTAGVAMVPLEFAPLGISLLTALSVALISVYVYFAAAQFIENRFARLTLAGMTLLLPAAGWESSANVANLRLFLVWGAFWAIVRTPKSWTGAVTDSLILLVASLSDPLPVFLVPLALLKLTRGRQWFERVAPLALFVGVAIQLGVMLPPGATRVAGFSWTDLPFLYGLRVAGSLFLGERWLNFVWKSFHDPLAYVALVSIVFLLGIGLAKAKTGKRLVLVALAAYSVVYFSVPIVLRGSSGIFPSADEVNLAGSRYMVAPILLLLAGLFITAESLRKSARIILTSLLVVLMAVTAAASYRLPLHSRLGPSWVDQISTAPEACVFSGDPSIRIPIAPGGNWGVDVPCERVLE